MRDEVLPPESLGALLAELDENGDPRPDHDQHDTDRNESHPEGQAS